jgi:hypothetical protein
MEYKNPLIVRFTADGSKKVEQVNSETIHIDTDGNWKKFKDLTGAAFGSQQFDYVMVTFDDSAVNADKAKLGSLQIKLNTLYKDATSANLKVFNRYDDKMYLMNPDYSGFYKLDLYAPKDDDILEKFESFGDEYAWQHHQAELFQKFSAFMPLSNGKYGANHEAILKDPGRGLDDEDLKDMFSWRSGLNVAPGLMGDDMVGMPGIAGRHIPDVELSYKDKPLEYDVVALRTEGMPGYIIPMRNVKGEFAKFQIGADVSKTNVKLKASAADGRTIQASEYLDKKSRIYKFKFKDGKETNLQAVAGDNDKQTWRDAKGTFNTHVKQDVKSILLERGYDIPEIIDKLNVVPMSKYIWPNPGTLTGTTDVRNVVTPSNAGFITAREPKNGCDSYVVLVAEGALKGMITAKYIDVTDATGKSFADKIAGDRGVIVAQVPGVAAKFVSSVSKIYNDTDLKIDGTYIALDADGRTNFDVCKNIHGAYHELAQWSNVSVLSWNPEQKGIDDALLAIHQGKITLDDMGIRYGTPEKLFPIENSTKPIPLLLNGQPAYTDKSKVAWQEEYGESRRARDARIKEAQNSEQKPVQNKPKPVEDKQKPVQNKQELDDVTKKLLESDEFREKLAQLTQEFMEK